MQIPRLALTALCSLLALHAAGAVTMVRDHAWLVRGAGDEPILGFRNVPWGKFNSLSVTFKLTHCTPADIRAFRVYRQPPNRDGCALTLSGLNLFWYGGTVEGPGGFATQPYIGSRNHDSTAGAPTLGPNGTITILNGTTFPDSNLWLNEGAAPQPLDLPAGLSDKLPAPEPGVTELRFASEDDADRARFFDGLDISSSVSADGATQTLTTAKTDFDVSAMGFDADGLWVEASLSRGTFNVATILQAIPVSLDGTAARTAAIRTLSEETPAPNVRRLRLDLAQSGTHLFRLRPAFAP